MGELRWTDFASTALISACLLPCSLFLASALPHEGAFAFALSFLLPQSFVNFFSFPGFTWLFFFLWLTSNLYFNCLRTNMFFNLYLTLFLFGDAQSWYVTGTAQEAGTAALKDAGVTMQDIEAAMVSYVYGESTSGNRAIYELGMEGIPIVNSNNNCSSGSTALYLARMLIAGGQNDCVMALGFEKMQKGPLAFGNADRESPIMKHLTHCATLSGGMPEKVKTVQRN